MSALPPIRAVTSGEIRIAPASPPPSGIAAPTYAGVQGHEVTLVRHLVVTESDNNDTTPCIPALGGGWASCKAHRPAKAIV